jgi:hypothetical protein
VFWIKRTKTATNAAGEYVGSAAVHYSVSVDHRGNVTGYTADPAKRGQFPADVCALVKAFHAGKPRVGLIEAEPAGGGKPAELAREPVPAGEQAKREKAAEKTK